MGYLDVYFDNVGGDILDFMLTRLNKNARIVLCGMSSSSPLTGKFGLKSDQVPFLRTVCLEGFSCWILCSTMCSDSTRPKGLESYLNLISQRAKIQGFIVYVPTDSSPIGVHSFS